MARSSSRRMTEESREAIEEGALKGESTRKIAKKIGAGPSTVAREAKANRAVREEKAARNAKPSVRCARRSGRQAGGGACRKRPTRLAACKNRRTRGRIGACPDFARKMRPATEQRPRIRPEGRPKRSRRGFPKRGCGAREAQEAHRARLAASRQGVDLSDEGPAATKGLVAPSLGQGQSFGAIWAAHGRGLPVCARAACAYREAGLFVPHVEPPRKVRLKPRRKKGGASGRDRASREGRACADFCALPSETGSRVVRADSVEGREGGSRGVLGLHLAACAFQIYAPKDRASPSAAARLGAMEAARGSRAAFEAALPAALADRGVGFDDWEGTGRPSLGPGKRRRRVFCCGARAANQKSQAGRDRGQLGRILPRGAPASAR